MQRLLWNERWAYETAEFVYNFLLFSSKILKTFVVVKETRTSYVEELVAIMYLGWHSSAHLLSISATYSKILTLIKSMIFFGAIRVSPSQICISTRGKDLFAQQTKVCRYLKKASKYCVLFLIVISVFSLTSKSAFCVCCSLQFDLRAVYR